MKVKLFTIVIVKMLITFNAMAASSLILSSDREEKTVNVENIQHILNDDYTPRDNISINGNEDFIPENGVVGGSGTENDPYIIEGWELNGISIKNTDKYFIIRKCLLIGFGWMDPGAQLSAITFDGVINGIVQECEFGTDCMSGIMLINSNYNIVENCSVNRSGSGLDCFHLADSDYNKFRYLDILNGKYKWVFLVKWSHNNEFHHCNLSDCYNPDTWNCGFELIASDDNKIFSCILKDAYVGIHSYISDDNEIYSCNISYCNFGISSNSDVYPLGNGNLIYHNNFFKNKEKNAIAILTRDKWYKEKEGNYRDDYYGFDILPPWGIGDICYKISFGNKDRHPLMKPYPEGTKY